MRPARPPAALQITTDTPATVTSQPPTLSISNNVMENKKQKSKSEKCYLVESTKKNFTKHEQQSNNRVVHYAS